MLRRSIGLTFMILILATAAAAQAHLSGRVYSETLTPIAGARVIAMQGDASWIAVTDETGRYELDLPHYGRYDLTAISRSSVFRYVRVRLTRPVPLCDGDVCFPIDPNPVIFVGRAR